MFVDTQLFVASFFLVGGGGVIQKVGPDPCSFNKNFRYLKLHR